MASGADNASSNGTMNAAVCALAAKEKVKLVARNVQIGCGGHVNNLVAQEATGMLGLTPTVAEQDLWEQNRKFGLTVEEETEEMNEPVKKRQRGKDVDDEISDEEEIEFSSDDESELSGHEDTAAELWEVSEDDELVATLAKEVKVAKSKRKHIRGPVDKVGP